MGFRTERVFTLRSLLWGSALVFVVATPATARAWLLHEHAATARAALVRLGADARDRMTAAWERARHVSPRFCPSPDSSGEKLYQAGQAGAFCVGFPVLTGLAADHSCSATDTRLTVASDFVLGVIKESENVELKLREASLPH